MTDEAPFQWRHLPAIALHGIGVVVGLAFIMLYMAGLIVVGRCEDLVSARYDARRRRSRRCEAARRLHLPAITAGAVKGEGMDTIQRTGKQLTSGETRGPREQPMTPELQLKSLRSWLGVQIRDLRGADGRPASRELALAVTALEDADNWIARHMGLLEIKD